MFDCFIGVDWSGAQKEFHKGIQVAEACAGEPGVQLVGNPSHPGGLGRWSRVSVMEYLIQRAGKERVLAGIDFAFAHPYPYYRDAEMNDTPGDAEALWRTVEDCNNGKPHLYGGGVWAHRTYGEYYNRPRSRGGKGKRFESRRRRTEEVAARHRYPSPTFNCVGPASVGTGSLAGMRMLHRLNAETGAEVAIWPFGVPDAGTRLTIVEIFPALYFAMADIKDKQRKNNPDNAIKCGLRYFDSQREGHRIASVPDNDDHDAMISAAAMRYIAERSDGMPPIPPQHRSRAGQEGWIFGAGWDKPAQ